MTDLGLTFEFLDKDRLRKLQINLHFRSAHPIFAEEKHYYYESSFVMGRAVPAGAGGLYGFAQF